MAAGEGGDSNAFMCTVDTGHTKSGVAPGGVRTPLE